MAGATVSGKAKITKMPKPGLTETFEKMAAQRLTVRAVGVRRVNERTVVVEYEVVKKERGA